MFRLQPTRTVRSSLWAVSFCVYTRPILVRADCTTGTTKHENAIIVVGLAEPQRKNPLGDRQPHSCRGTRAVSSWPSLHYQKGGGLQGRKLGHLSAVLGVGCKLPKKGRRNKATIRRKRWGAFGCPYARDNHKQSTSSPAGYERYSILLFLFVHIDNFLQSILKDFFLANSTHIQSEGWGNCWKLKEFSTVCLGGNFPHTVQTKGNTQLQSKITNELNNISESLDIIKDTMFDGIDELSRIESELNEIKKKQGILELKGEK